MTNSEKEELLAKALIIYIKEKHTQEECVGFIDGFNKALESIKEIRA